MLPGWMKSILKLLRVTQTLHSDCLNVEWNDRMLPFLLRIGIWSISGPSPIALGFLDRSIDITLLACSLLFCIKNF